MDCYFIFGQLSFSL